MQSIKQRLFLSFLTVFFACTASCTNQTQKEKKSENKNTVIKSLIPEWLKLNVEEVLPKKGFNIWIPTGNFETSSLLRVPAYPRKFKQEELLQNPALKNFIIETVEDSTVLRLSGVRNEQISAQIAISSSEKLHDVGVEISDLIAIDSEETIHSSNIKTRFVGYHKVERARSEYVWSPKLEEIIGEGTSGNMNPNVVGDILYEKNSIDVPAYRSQPIWFTFHVPKNVTPGVYIGKLLLKANGKKREELKIQLTISYPVLPDPKDYQFNLDLWVNPSAIAGYYGLESWSEEHWKLIEIYLKDYADKGGKHTAVTITHEPWHKPWLNNTTRPQTYFGYESMIQWIRTKEGLWTFDYSIFDRYISLAKKLGVADRINAFSITPFRTDQALWFWDEVSQKQEVQELKIEDEEYALIWGVFLKDFKRHLIHKGWYETTYLGFDEKPQEVLLRVAKIIEQSTPEFLDRIIIAGHAESTFLAQNLSISYMFFPGQPLEKKAKLEVIETIEKRNSEKKNTTFYLCAEPAHPNTLTYSPAVEARLVPWLTLKYKVDGYLRWAYNNWTDNLSQSPVFLHNQGDDYYVYPGTKGPISSIRWELLKEGIEDFELFTIVKKKKTLTNKKMDAIIDLATRNQDGRYKEVQDMIVVRQMLLNK